MRKLPDIRPTPEQLAIISKNVLGTQVIRGAAGSGKTTTALLKLRALTGVYVSRRKREGRANPVRILVLTFNRTLRGYIEALASSQTNDEIDLSVSTAGHWAWDAVGCPTVVDSRTRSGKILSLGAHVELPRDYLVEEVNYVLGRFPPDKLGEYLSARREGRGIKPRVERAVREQILADVIGPFLEWKEEKGLVDWDDVSLRAANGKIQKYDIVIIDEAQDFSANQIRSILPHLADVHSLVLVVDTAQRIYARGFVWQEAGIRLKPGDSSRLEVNYRNTVEIAAVAASLMAGLPLDPDGSIPDPDACKRNGDLPVVVRGKFSDQMDWAVDFIQSRVDLESESVAFLHPLGYGWFSHVRERLQDAGLPYVEITRKDEWPEGDENIALSTLASAKGLEFDHVLILGLSAEVLPDGEQEDDDDRLAWSRRLVAMGIGRAAKTLTLGYRHDGGSRLIAFIDEDLYELVEP